MRCGILKLPGLASFLGGGRDNTMGILDGILHWMGFFIGWDWP